MTRQAGLRKIMGWLTGGLILGMSLVGSAENLSVPIGIPFKPDPPIEIDGNLGEWGQVPGAISVSDEAQVTFGKGAWQGPKDMSGTVKLAWRREYLFVAASITDDVIRQDQAGSNLWKGDHVEVYLDVKPDADPNRTVFGDGQYMIAFSPGNFQHTGDPMADTTPEAFCFRPLNAPLEGALVAASRTEDGWDIEMAIPWKSVGVTDTPGEGMPLNIEVGLSATDGNEPQQECMMTLSSARWSHSRTRLLKAVLAGADGKPPLLAGKTPIFDTLVLKGKESKTWTGSLPAVPKGKVPVLRMLARLDMSKVAGYCPALRVWFNGQALSGSRLFNQPVRVKVRNGKIYSTVSGERMSVCYAPNYTSPNTDPYYGLYGKNASLWQFDLSGLVRDKDNTVTVQRDTADSVTNPLVLSNVEIVFRQPPPPPRKKAGPPTGPLPVIEPRQDFETDFTVRELPDAAFEVICDGETFRVNSKFSTPEGKWVRGSNTSFKFERKIIQKLEAVIIQDTFTNLTGKPLPLMHRHEVVLAGTRRGLWINGLERRGSKISSSAPSNPTTYATTDRHGMGLLPLDDVFRVHITNYAFADAAGIADNNLVLRPGAKYTAEWAVIPTTKPDYWRFINSARRLVGANFPIPWLFAFLRNGPHTDSWSDDKVRDFLTYKDATMVCASLGYPRYKGRIPQGTAFQFIPHDSYRKSFARWRKLHPNACYVVYFHCYIDVRDEAPELYRDSRVLRPDGKQGDYGKSIYKLFFPTETNTYGAAIKKNVDIILDEIGADGVYWDEHEYSRMHYHYGKPWDGCSGDIDPRTMQVKRLKSSVTLLTAPWRLKLAKYIQSRGPLFGNGVPYTRAMAALHFPCFVETGSITNCTQAHLYSPVALGDHLTERSEEDAYRDMLAALDYGCIYCWYNDLLVVPTHHHLTRYMYPATPLELHAGYFIGEKRIITRKSGLYGWGDASKHEVHVFDDSGREVKNFKAPLVTRDGKTYTELRIGEDWSAAIIRQAADR